MFFEPFYCAPGELSVGSADAFFGPHGSLARRKRYRGGALWGEGSADFLRGLSPMIGREMFEGVDTHHDVEFIVAKREVSNVGENGSYALCAARREEMIECDVDGDDGRLGETTKAILVRADFKSARSRREVRAKAIHDGHVAHGPIGVTSPIFFGVCS